MDVPPLENLRLTIYTDNGAVRTGEAVIDHRGKNMVLRELPTSIGPTGATGATGATGPAGADGAPASSTTIAKVMTADQSINSSTTLTNVTDLVFAIGANETWVYDMLIECGDALSTTLAQIDFTKPAGSTFKFWAFIFQDDWTSPYNINAGGSNYSGSPIQIPGFTDRAVIQVKAYLKTAGTAGNLQLQFAQLVSDASNLTFKQGSFGVGNKVS